MIPELEKIAQTVHRRLLKNELHARTITLKIKYGDFKQITRSRTFPHPIDDLDTIRTTAIALLRSTDLENKKIRLLGISLSNFEEEGTGPDKDRPGQLELF